MCLAEGVHGKIKEEVYSRLIIRLQHYGRCDMKKYLSGLIVMMMVLCSCTNNKDNENDTVSGSDNPVLIQEGDQGTLSAEEDISGDYYAISCKDKDGRELTLNDEVLHLNNDGTGVFEIDGESFSLRYELKNRNQLTFTDEDGDTFNGNYYSGIIAGTYFNDYYYMFTNDRDLYLSYTSDQTSTVSGNNTDEQFIEKAESESVYYTMQTLYEPKYGIRTAVALVPYGWHASVTVFWGLCSLMTPALATVTMVSPDGKAMIEMQSTMGYLQMARKGVWTPEGTYLDNYNIYLNYRNAHQYNDYLLGVYGCKGTIINEQGPGYDLQLLLNGAANEYMNGLSSANGIQGVSSEGTYEKTSYFVTEGDYYEVEAYSAVIMAETVNGYFDTYSWLVPFSAVFFTSDEEAYSNYFKAFDNVVANSAFTAEFNYIVQRNARYLNEMMSNYLLQQVYSPSLGDINGWDREYSGGYDDKYINAWCDVIKEQDTYTTVDGNAIKVPTSYDAVYQNGDLIYMGPQIDHDSDWTQLGKAE